MTRLSLATFTVPMCMALLVGCGDDTAKGSAAGGTGGTAGSGGVAGAGGDGYFAWALVERFTRDKVTKTMASVLTLNEGDAEPRLIRLDERCFFHTPLRWDLTGIDPPKYGQVTLTGPGAKQWPLDYDANGVGYGSSTPEWDAGDLMGLHATGAEMPSFDFETVVPPEPTLTSKDLTALAQFEWTIHRSEPLELTWTPVSGEVHMLILQLDANASPQSGLRCVFPGMDGKATVTADFLGHLGPIGGSITQNNFYFHGITRKTATIDDVDIEFGNINGKAVRVNID